MVGEEICNIVLKFLNGEVMKHSLNYIYIALIPKVKNHLLVSEFRPISLFNVLANKLKESSLSNISCNQSVFIPG